MRLHLTWYLILILLVLFSAPLSLFTIMALNNFDLIENWYVIFQKCARRSLQAIVLFHKRIIMLIPFTNYYHFIRHKTLSVEKLILRLGLPIWLCLMVIQLNVLIIIISIIHTIFLFHHFIKKIYLLFNNEKNMWA